MSARKYVEENDWAAMMATKRLAGVTPEGMCNISNSEKLPRNVRLTFPHR